MCLSNGYTYFCIWTGCDIQLQQTNYNMCKSSKLIGKCTHKMYFWSMIILCIKYCRYLAHSPNKQNYFSINFHKFPQHFVKLFVVHVLKRYLIIDQQIARHFVLYSEYLYHPLPFYGTQIITLFLTSTISANQDKWLGF